MNRIRIASFVELLLKASGFFSVRAIQPLMVVAS